MAASDEPGDASAFWRFSLAFYARPGVPQACLALQDEAGADVNVVLYALYAAQEGRLLGAVDAARIDAFARPWRESVVRPLRAVRRALKGEVGEFTAGGHAALRDAVKRAELAAEQRQQEAMERALPVRTLGEVAPSRAAAARAGLAACAGLGRPFPEAAVAGLLTAFAQAVGD